mgnify:CR=1 FL=1
MSMIAMVETLVGDNTGILRVGHQKESCMHPNDCVDTRIAAVEHANAKVSPVNPSSSA